MTQVHERLPPELLARPVRGRNLSGPTLGEALGRGPTLLVFLRHFGWLFCRRDVAALRARVASDPGFPPVVLAHMGSVEEGDAFLAERWPEARAIAAAGTELHQAFGLGRARFRQLFGLAVLRATPGALRHGASRPVGDPFQLAGHFLVADGAVRLRHPHAHVGEALDLDAIAAAAS